MNEKLTIKDAMENFQDNPKAASLALGMVLMQHSRDEVQRLTEILDKAKEKEIEELKEELSYWQPLGMKWLRFKGLLADKEECLM